MNWGADHHHVTLLLPLWHSISPLLYCTVLIMSHCCCCCDIQYPPFCIALMCSAELAPVLHWWATNSWTEKLNMTLHWGDSGSEVKMIKSYATNFPNCTPVRITFPHLTIRLRWRPFDHPIHFLPLFNQPYITLHSTKISSTLHLHYITSPCTRHNTNLF